MARVSREKKEEAAVWLASGQSADWVAARVGVHVGTVRAWRRRDAVFGAAYERQLGGLQAQGLQAIAERHAAPPARVKARPGATALEALQGVALEIGRKEARRG